MTHNELRYLNLGSLTPELYTSAWEFDGLIPITEPTLLRWTQANTIVEFWQGPYWNGGKWINKQTFIGDYIEGLPEVTFCRPFFKAELTYETDVSYFVMGPEVTNWVLYHPNSPRKDYEGRKELNKVFYKMIMDLLKEEDIETHWGLIDYSPEIKGDSPTRDETITNDIFAKHSDGKWKKFAGGAYKYTKYGYGYQDISMTFDMDYETADLVRKFEGSIRVKKFDVEEIRDVVGGLREVNSNLDREKFEDKMANRICDMIGLTRRDSILTQEEESIMREIGNRRNTEKSWLYYGDNTGFPDWA